MNDEIDLEDNFAHALQAFLAGKLRPSEAGCPHPGLLSARNGGKLLGDEAQQVDAHLERCEPCRDRCEALASFAYQSLREIVDEVEDVRAVPLARALAARSADVSSSAASTSRTPARLRPAIGVAFVVVATAFVALRLPGAISVLLRADDGWFAERVRASAMQPAPLAEEPPPPSSLDGSSQKTSEAPQGRDATSPSSFSPAPAAAAPRASAWKPAEAVPVVVARATSRGGGARAPARQLAGDAPAPRASIESSARVPAVASDADASPAIVAIARSNDEILWRIEAAQIFRSDDHGQSWRPQEGLTSSPLLAASAPSGEVCWAAGKGGAVLRTTDGRSWHAVRPPTADDLVQVSAWSAVSATVRSARGERFSTVDGGATWSRL